MSFWPVVITVGPSGRKEYVGSLTGAARGRKGKWNDIAHDG
jgi:hypothetical protein